MNHIMEQYFSDFDDNTSDYLAEGLMRSIIRDHCCLSRRLSESDKGECGRDLEREYVGLKS